MKTLIIRMLASFTRRFVVSKETTVPIAYRVSDENGNPGSTEARPGEGSYVSETI